MANEIIEDIKEGNITPTLDDYKAFGKLLENKDFQKLMDFMDKYLIYNAYELLKWNFTEYSDEQAKRKFFQAKGAQDLWNNKIMRWVQTAPEMVAEAEANIKEQKEQKDEK